jgi:hypothetical protein
MKVWLFPFFIFNSYGFIWLVHYALRFGWPPEWYYIILAARQLTNTQFFKNFHCWCKFFFRQNLGMDLDWNHVPKSKTLALSVLYWAFLWVVECWWIEGLKERPRPILNKRLSWLLVVSAQDRFRMAFSCCFKCLVISKVWGRMLANKIVHFEGRQLKYPLPPYRKLFTNYLPIYKANWASLKLPVPRGGGGEWNDSLPEVYQLTFANEASDKCRHYAFESIHGFWSNQLWA